MRDIAEFRAHEKYDPADYARRTVIKVQGEFQRGTAFSPSSEASPSQTSEPSRDP